MAKHISVTVENGKVTAEPNRLPCGPGDTVEWDLRSSAEAGELRIEFEKVLALPGEERLDNEVVNPFTGSPISAPGRITGTVRTDVLPGRCFIYRFFRGDDPLSWENPMSPTQDFGGLDVPPPPPRG